MRRLIRKLTSLTLGAVLTLSSLPCAAAEQPTSVPDFSAIASAYLAQSKSVHPSILFSEEDLPSLREKAEAGVSKTAFTAMRTLADSYMRVSAAPYKFVGGGISGRMLQLQIATLAFYGHLLGEEGAAYREHAAALLVSAAEQASLEVCLKENDALAVGDFGCAFAIGYDWLFETLDETQRGLLRGRMEELGAWLYEASVTAKQPGTGARVYWCEDNPTRSAWNWNTVAHTALGMISMVTGEHPEWLERALVRIGDYLRYSKNEDGLPQEGLGYTGYGMRMVVLIDATLLARTGTSLIDFYPDVQHYPDYLRWATLPAGRAAIDTNQSNSLGNISVPFYIASRYGQAENLYAILEGYGIAYGDPAPLTSVWGGDSFDLPQLIVFEDQALTPSQPSDGGMNNFGGQEVICRTGFAPASEGDSIALASMRVRAEYMSIWHHPDCGSVTFHALGQSFVIDLGAGSREAAQHNALLLGGTGTTNADKATLISAETIADGVYLVSVKISPAYQKVKVKDYTRTMLFVDGETPYLYVFDRTESAKALDGALNWYTGKTNTVSPLKTGGMRISGDGRAVCDMYVFEPSGEAKLTAKDKTPGVNVLLPASDNFTVGTLFASAPGINRLPSVTGEFSEDGVLCVTVVRTDKDGTAHTDTILSGTAGTVSFTTAARAPETSAEETETTVPPEETEAESSIPAAPEDTENASTSSPLPWLVAGGAALLLAAAAAFAVRKKKK
ncbi:MAG: hypothetical protein ACI3XP_00315 [Eubacteriales bacterium]